ncbi:unnamed protein product [Citrullus colocynthis]|uniref:Uncharacterized protein n=1 Tax=Citrullus colocynthis TaxID=252529 RepID=A0ABP0YC04_9ROSI
MHKKSSDAFDCEEVMSREAAYGPWQQDDHNPVIFCSEVHSCGEAAETSLVIIKTSYSMESLAQNLMYKVYNGQKLERDLICIKSVLLSRMDKQTKQTQIIWICRSWSRSDPGVQIHRLHPTSPIAIFAASKAAIL